MAIVTGQDNNFGVYCNLLEYNNIPAVIMNSEISKYKINYAKKFPIGKIIPCMIYGIDEEKNHINLLYKNITPEVHEKLENDYNDKLHIYKLFNELNHYINNMNSIMEMIWNCMEHIIDNDIPIREYYKLLLDDPNIIFNYDINNIFSEELKQTIISGLNSRITKTDITVELQFNMIILENGFMDKIKNIFDGIDNKLICTSSPVYAITLTGKTIEDTKTELVSFFDKLCYKLKNIKHNITYDINNVKVIKERFYTMSYIKPLTSLK
jgi:translation initiation factor 2 alpha subunit (eIF-2alpha)